MSDKSMYLVPRLATAVYESPVGPIRIRALSRAEVMDLRALDDPSAIEARALALACVEPVFTADEVEALRAAWPSPDVEALSNAVLELSGLMEAADPADRERTFRRDG